MVVNQTNSTSLIIIGCDTRLATGCKITDRRRQRHSDQQLCSIFKRKHRLVRKSSTKKQFSEQDGLTLRIIIHCQWQLH